MMSEIGNSRLWVLVAVDIRRTPPPQNPGYDLWPDLSTATPRASVVAKLCSSGSQSCWYSSHADPRPLLSPAAQLLLISGCTSRPACDIIATVLQHKLHQRRLVRRRVCDEDARFLTLIYYITLPWVPQ